MNVFIRRNNSTGEIIFPYHCTACHACLNPTTSKVDVFFLYGFNFHILTQFGNEAAFLLYPQVTIPRHDSFRTNPTTKCLQLYILGRYHVFPQKGVCFTEPIEQLLPIEKRRASLNHGCFTTSKVDHGVPISHFTCYRRMESVLYPKLFM